MELSNEDDFPDEELSELLAQWRVPSLSPGKKSMWQRLWHSSIRVPLPLAALVLILFALAAWSFGTWSASRVRGESRAQDAIRLADFSGLRPVSELRLRKIERQTK